MKSRKFSPRPQCPIFNGDCAYALMDIEKKTPDHVSIFLTEVGTNLLSVMSGIVEFTNQCRQWGVCQFTHERVSIWLNDDGSFQIVCNVKHLKLDFDAVTDDDLINAKNDASLKQVRPLRKELSFKNILNTSLLSDFFVVKVGEDMFNCHRCILVSHSDVFRKMLQNTSMNEVCNGVVEITVCSATSVRYLLEFMYTGKVENLNGYAEESLIISDKYDVSILKEMCEQQLISQLNAANVCQVLVFAYQHSANHLKLACLKFLLENQKAVFKSKEWETLKDLNLVLASDILEWILNGGEGSLNFK